MPTLVRCLAAIALCALPLVARGQHAQDAGANYPWAVEDDPQAGNTAGQLNSPAAAAADAGYGSPGYGANDQAVDPAYGAGNPAYGDGNQAYGTGNPAYGSADQGYDTGGQAGGAQRAGTKHARTYLCVFRRVLRWPRAAPARDNVGSQPITPHGAAAARTAAHPLGLGAVPTMLGSLGAVVGLFLLVMWVVRRSSPRRGGALPREVVEVLGHSPLTARQQMHLLRLGNKLVLVAVSPAGIDTLAEVTDPIDVDHLTGLCYQNQPNSASVAFRQVFREADGAQRGERADFSRLDAIAPARSSRRPAMHAEIDREPVAPVRRCAALIAAALPVGVLLLLTGSAAADDALSPATLAPSLFGGPQKWTSPEGLSSTLQVMVLMTIISLAPAVLLMTTAFVRIIVVLGLLRQALGTQQLPPSQVITSIALFLTLLIMSPVWKQVYDESIKPYTDRQISLDEAWTSGTRPIRHFMSVQLERTGNSEDIWLFYKYLPADTPQPSTYDEVSLAALLPAFMLSELKTAFLIGFRFIFRSSCSIS